MEKITEWADKQPDYGICNPPMDGDKALTFLANYLLDVDFHDPMPENVEQVYTHIVFEILNKYSKDFRKEYKKWRKKYGC